MPFETARFTELMKSPEHIHTYRLTPLARIFHETRLVERRKET